MEGVHLYDNVSYLYGMKVTALISEELIKEVMAKSGGKNITESITIALKEYVSQKQVSYLIDEVEQEPLAFNEDAAQYIRTLNRKP